MSAPTIPNYRIVGELRRGGMGVIYRAVHVGMGQMAVVKTLLPEFTNNAEIAERFFQEARAAARLDDPGIVRIFDQGRLADGSGYIVMELLQGMSLAERLQTAPPATAQALVLFRQAVRAVGVAHSQGIIHRDLKPDNLFIVRDPEVAIGERVKVLDFGIAKLRSDSVLRTATNLPMGTPAYMSPEQWSGAGRVDHRTDLYALGIILVELLVHMLPFQGPSLPEFMDQHRFAQPILPGAVDSRFAPFDSVVSRLLAKDPNLRPSSCDELLQVLPSAPSEASIVAPHLAPTVHASSSFGEQRPMPSANRNRRIVMVAAAVSLTVGGAIVVWTQLRQRSAPPEQSVALHAVNPSIDAPTASIEAPIEVDVVDASFGAELDATPALEFDAGTLVPRDAPSPRIAMSRQRIPKPISAKVGEQSHVETPAEVVERAAPPRSPPEVPDAPVRESRTFAVGSSASEVRSVQGQPDNVERDGAVETWRYGRSSVVIRHGSVIDFINSGKNLRVRQ